MVIGYNVNEEDTIAKASPSKAVRHASEARGLQSPPQVANRVYRQVSRLRRSLQPCDGAFKAAC
jgi:hypothetical protein